MGFLDRLLGRTPTEQHRTSGPAAGGPMAYGNPRPAHGGAPSGTGASEDERAIARYRYLLRTAPPEQLEALHAEAFSQLSPEQRQQLLRELSATSPQEAGTSAEPADLARAATRAEMRQPGTLQQTFSRGSFGGGGMGMGGMFAGSMMGTIAGVVVGSAIADMMLGGYGDSPEAQDAGDAGSDAGADTGSDSDTGGDAGGDAGGSSGDGGNDGGDAGFADTSGGDAGGGDWAGGGDSWGGGDLGGGDFGGGDFGGGDFGGF
jgi:hypothetical protein